MIIISCSESAELSSDFCLSIVGGREGERERGRVSGERKGAYYSQHPTLLHEHLHKHTHTHAHTTHRHRIPCLH